MIQNRPALVRCLFPILLSVLAPSRETIAQDRVDADASEATLGAAQRWIGQQRFQKAVDALEPLVAGDPSNGRAWYLLGNALHGKGDFEKALEAHLAAAAFPDQEGRAIYNAGCACARLDRKKDACEYLARAVKLGGVDPVQMSQDADLQTIVNEPEFHHLFLASSYARPFVENVSVLREWRGEAAFDQFGWVARNIGDVDGDGKADVVTSSPSHEGGAGKVYVYSSGTGELLWSMTGGPGHGLGLSTEEAGDVDGNGTPDTIVSAPGAARAYVCDGKTGKVILELEGESTGDSFGRDVVGIGDLDKDGIVDLIVGAPKNDGNGRDAGRVYVFSGKTGKVLHTWDGEGRGDAFGSTAAGWCDKNGILLAMGAPNAGPGNRGRVYVHKDLSGTPAFVIDAAPTGGQLGSMFISILGDADGDGHRDIYASDWSDNAEGPSTGRIVVHSGKTGEKLLDLHGEKAGDGFGIGPADAGDVDGDGCADLVVGAWRQGNAAPSGGKVYVHSGKGGRLLHTYSCQVPGDTFGFDATGLGDIDGDGTPDFLVTSAWSWTTGPRAGRVFVLSGRLAEK
jgi:hypothetical protein